MEASEQRQTKIATTYQRKITHFMLTITASDNHKYLLAEVKIQAMLQYIVAYFSILQMHMDYHILYHNKLQYIALIKHLSIAISMSSAGSSPERMLSHNKIPYPSTTMLQDTPFTNYHGIE